jgi:uncharacterized phosphosugar-binding protein
MSAALQYFQELEHLIAHLKTQAQAIHQVSIKSADAIESGHWVRLFGSGHSVLPVQDCFPRYGGYVGFFPLMDPRLMWTTVSGPGGAEELLWLERQEGYMDHFLRHTTWHPRDVLIVISHGGQNAAPVEVAAAAKKSGLYVAALTSRQNHQDRPATHSSGQKIGDIADILLDNGVASEDAAIPIVGVSGKVAGLSTLSAIALIQAVVAETAEILAQRDYFVKPFASPNADGVEAGRNDRVYVDFRQRLAQSGG